MKKRGFKKKQKQVKKSFKETFKEGYRDTRFKEGDRRRLVVKTLGGIMEDDIIKFVAVKKAKVIDRFRSKD